MISGFSLLRTAAEFERHGRTGSAEHGDHERVDIELTLMGGTEDTREDLLGGGPVPGPIAAAHFARDHGGPQRLLGAPIRGIDGRRIEQEGEERREFKSEVRREPLDIRHRAGMIETAIDAIQQVPAGDGETVRGDAPRVVAIAQCERLLEHRAHGVHEARARMIGLQQPTASEQMRETRLMNRVGEAPIGRPAVADHHAGEVFAEQRRGFGKPAARLNRVDGRIRRGDGPEPLQRAGDLPAGLIGCDDRTAADRVAERVICGPRLTRGAVHRVHQAAARHGQPILLAKERRDLPERQAELLVEDDGPRDGLRPELRRRGTQRVRRLQPMTTLDAATTRAALSHVDPKVTDDDLGDGQLFLILASDARFHDGAVAVGTPRRQTRFICFIDAWRNRAVRFRAVGAARLSPGSLRMAGERFRERRRLPKSGSPCRIELLLQPLVLLAQPVALTLDPLKLALQPLDLATRPLELRDRLVLRPRRWRVVAHAPVMPEPRDLYKTERLGIAITDGRARASTR